MWVQSPGSGRSPGGGHGNPLPYSCLENPVDRGAWRAVVRAVTQSRHHSKPLSVPARIESVGRFGECLHLGNTNSPNR